jgi:hypothetical protein
MIITKDNVNEIIIDYFKQNKIRFNIQYQDDDSINYEIFISYIKCYIQIEYGEILYFQFYTEVNEFGESIFHNSFELYHNDSEQVEKLQSEIDSLIEETKKINSAISNINKKIEQIKDICEENQLDINQFITILYDFDE